MAVNGTKGTVLCHLLPQHPCPEPAGVGVAGGEPGRGARLQEGGSAAGAGMRGAGERLLSDN